MDELEKKEVPEVPSETPRKKKVVRRKRPATLTTETTTATGAPKRYVPKKVMLHRGATRIQLINDLAEGIDRELLAAKHRVTLGDISDFFVQHQYEINEQKKRIEENMKDEYALLTVHNKRNRIATYEEQIRLTEEYIAWCETTGRPIPVQIIKLQQTALRNVAEEMGDLKTSVAIENTVVENTINGVDPKDLV